MKQKKQLFRFLGLIVVLIVLNIVGQNWFKRFDLTHDKRYTLSPASLKILDRIHEPTYVDIFLEGKFPADIRRLQIETKQILEEFQAYNSLIKFNFINPIEDAGDEKDAIIEAFYDKGMQAINITVEDKGKQSQEIVFPWAIAYSGERDVKIPLLKNLMGASTEEKVISSIQHLEYAFANAFHNVSQEKSKKVAVLKGNGQPHDILQADFLKQVRENYFIAPFTLDSVATNIQKASEHLNTYDLAVMVKPKEKFSDAEKLVLDQYIMNGGKMIWLVEATAIEMDSLYRAGNQTFAMPQELNLEDLFFRYGVRIYPNLVKDLMATPIVLTTGQEGSNAQYTQFPWFYSPLVFSESNHPIVKNIDGVRFEFPNSIDTLDNGIKKQVLLSSSKYSKRIGTPTEVQLEMVTEKPSPEEFLNQGNIPLAVLLEGQFTSVYKNRVLPATLSTFKEMSTETQQIFISDGDVILNQLDQEYNPLEMGYDKWTSNMYGNKEFIMNCVNYLLDDNGLIHIRSKEVKIPMLDREKVHAEYTKVQIITLATPLGLLILCGIIFQWIRKRRFAR